MKKLFVDTNIVIDLLSRREPYYDEAATLFSLADKNQVELSISSLTIANTSYVLLGQMDSAKAKSILRILRLIVKILPLDDKIVGLGFERRDFLRF
jgi:predicted nucleic acid-binding protein